VQQDIYFDDVTITHKKSPIVQSDEYYPFGLTFNSYSRENGVPNQYLYNGKERQEELLLGWFDYGARMLDPAIGRWIVTDPLSSQYAKWTPYAYALDNPIKFIDPDGQKIVPVNNKREYRAAIRYLRRSGIARDVIRTLKRSETIFYVGDDGTRSARFDSRTNVINWSPLKGIETTDGGYQSPALLLLHELGHAELELTSEAYRESKNDSDDQYGNKGDKMVIETIESPAADELNKANEEDGIDTREAKREDHGKKYYWAESPISNEPSEYQGFPKDSRQRDRYKNEFDKYIKFIDNTCLGCAGPADKKEKKENKNANN
jgi:RHS repeat-associated protein